MLALPVLCFAQGFEDVSPAHPNFEAVEWLYSNNLVEGYRIGRQKEFRPEQPVSRAAAIKMLIGVSGIPFSGMEEREAPFPDVPKSAWFAQYVQTALDTGVVTGFMDGNFHPASQVTRAEMLAMVLRIFDAPIHETEEGDWTTPFLDLAQFFRIIEKDDDTHTALNRGDVAEILYRTKWVSDAEFSEIFKYAGAGVVSVYPTELEGKKTANGEYIDSGAMTAAHRTLPFGTRVRIWQTDRPIVVTINDRLPENSSHVFTLSKKAFALLKKEKNGETYIEFEVFSAPGDELPSVPEYVRPSLSDERHEQPPLPESISQKISELRGQIEAAQKIKPIFDETVIMLATGFFENFTMRRPLPQKIVAGTVINFSGTTKQFGHKKATMFLQPITDGGDKKGAQLLFTGSISGKNFAFPVIFDQEGEFLVGVVLDEENTSRVETIEVVRLFREQVMPLSKKLFEKEFDVRVLPEEQKVVWELPKLNPTDLLKVSFAQNYVRKSLFLEGGIDELTLPYTWFDQFKSQENLSVDIYAAESNDGTIPQRVTGWTKLSYKNFDLVPGFLDVESEKVSIHDFPRWRRNLESFSLEGKILTSDVTLAEDIFITTPTGYVRKIPYVQNGDNFSFSIKPEEWGAYAIEVIADTGEILFNRELYFSEKFILPILPPRTIKLTSETVPGVRAWINKVRGEQNISSVLSSAELNTFAQQYAERMAREDFVAHTTPTGQTFLSRIKAADLTGKEFGENLGFGSSLQIALNGLKSSGSHYKNLMARKWKRVGIGVKQTKKGWYVTQVFGW